MKHRSLTLATAICLLACMAGCGQQPQISAPQNEPPTGNFQTSTADSAAIPSGETQSIPPAENTGRPAGKISAEDALAIALDNAGVPEDDAYNIKNEKDSDNGIPLYDIEFETDYGDYDFEVAIADGRIVGGDYEVDEEWLEFARSEVQSFLRGTFLEQAPIFPVSATTGKGLDALRDALFAFNFPEASATRQILENKLADGTVLLYALPEEVYSFCARSFAAPEFLHSAALLLEQWKRLSETSLYKQLFVQVCGQHIELACFAPQGRLRLANSFEVRSTRDILYYILYVWKQEGLDQLNDRLFLSGSPARCAELRQALSLYLRHVSPVPLPAEAYLRREEWADAPLDIIYLFS